MSIDQNFGDDESPEEKEHLDKLDKAMDRFRRRLEDLAIKGKLGNSVEEAVATAFKAVDVQKGLVLHPTFRQVLKERLLKVLTDDYSQRRGYELAKKNKGKIAFQAWKDSRNYIRQVARDTYENSSGKALRAQARKALEVLEVVATDIPGRIGGIDKVIAQIETVKELDFIKGIIGTKALVLVESEGAIHEVREKLAEQKGELDTLLPDLKKAIDESRNPTPLPEGAEVLHDPTGGADGELRRQLRRAYELGDRYFPTLGEMSAAIENALSDLDCQVNEQLLAAYIASNSITVENLKAVKAAADLGISLFNDLLKKTNTSGIFVRVADLTATSTLIAVREAAIKTAGDKFKASESMTEMFTFFNEKPDSLAERLQQKQEDALEVFLKVLGTSLSATLLTAPGVAEMVMKVFDIFARIVQDVVKAILEQRMKAGRAMLPTKPGEAPSQEALWAKVNKAFETASENIGQKVEGALKQAMNREVQGVADRVSAALNPLIDKNTGTDILGLVYDPGKLGESGGFAAFDPIQLEAMLSRLIVPPVVEWVVQYCKIPAAEMFSGDALTSLLNDIQFSRAPLVTVLQPAVKRQKPTPITEDNFAGEFPDRIGSRQVEAENTNVARSQIKKEPYSLYIAFDFDGVKVWGRYDTSTKDWTARDIDPGSFSDWSNSLVKPDSLTENKQTTDGSYLWVHSPEMKTDYVAFMPAGGEGLKFGHQMDYSKGPRSRRYDLRHLTEKFKVTYSIESLYQV